MLQGVDKEYGFVSAPEHWELVHQEGAWPFHHTLQEFKDSQGRHIKWEARAHRKRHYYRVHGESEAELVLCPYAPHRCSWWIGLTFFSGSLMFVTDRKSVVWGKRVLLRVDLGGRRI